MAYSIRIIFTGLSLWVPDKDKMYVLLPFHGGSEPHFQHLYHWRALLGGKPAPPDPVNLEGFELNCAPGLTGMANASVPPGIVDINEFAGKVPRDLLTGAGDHLAARVILPGGQPFVLDTGVRWWIGGRTHAFMTYTVGWFGQVDSGPTQLIRRPLAGGTSTSNGLEPDGGELELRIYNVPEPDLPGFLPSVKKVACCDTPHHFSAYYDLLKTPTNLRKMPRFAGRTGHCPPCMPDTEGEGRHGEHREKGRSDDKRPDTYRGGSPFTCMMATSPPDDGGNGNG